MNPAGFLRTALAERAEVSGFCTISRDSVSHRHQILEGVGAWRGRGGDAAHGGEEVGAPLVHPISRGVEKPYCTYKLGRRQGPPWQP